MYSSFATLAVLLSALTLAGAPPQPIIFHVTPAGSDTNAGVSLQTAFATPEQALQAVRELRRSGSSNQPVTVYLHQGVYALTKPLELTPDDSGVNWSAFENEHPVLSGGRALHGWKDVVVNGRNLWAMEIPDVREGKWYFRDFEPFDLSGVGPRPGR